MIAALDHVAPIARDEPARVRCRAEASGTRPGTVGRGPIARAHARDPDRNPIEIATRDGIEPGAAASGD